MKLITVGMFVTFALLIGRCDKHPAFNEGPIVIVAPPIPAPSPSASPTPPIPSNCFVDAEGGLICYPIDPQHKP